jgi:5-methyltetrahydrofolate--homocysteine methyltransferase
MGDAIMSDFDMLKKAVMKGAENEAVVETKAKLDEDLAVQAIIDQGLIAAMDDVGEEFSRGRLFVPQMLRSAKTMQACMSLLKPHFTTGDVTSKGRLLIGTVKGDLHDIGKNLVAMMMEGAGFEITDLGVDVAPDSFVQKALEIEPDMVGMSALVATTMPAMRTTLEAIEGAGLRERLKIIIGGAPVTEKFARDIGADAYAPDAGSAVARAKKLLDLS